MHANISTWRLNRAVQGEDEYAAFIAGLLSNTLPLARTLGLIDAIIVRSGLDEIVAINLYELADDAESAWERSSQLIAQMYGDKLEFVSRITGSAHDMPELTGRVT